ncbi:MAG: HypC/HybG/HupF family hydrogenase formation chaperone [Propionibacteriaceae bacterium]|jgi:hydrogenase expression/formation protein HypC|nr:HypC/HybG/HupF family hydrogenase formation chaperone [Propionibacteriaceae bacterium]
MCVAVPTRIEEITAGPIPTARLRVGGKAVECSLALFPQAAVGDHVLVQHGLAVELLDEEAARQSLAAFAELGLDVSQEGA